MVLIKVHPLVIPLGSHGKIVIRVYTQRDGNNEIQEYCEKFRKHSVIFSSITFSSFDILLQLLSS